MLRWGLPRKSSRGGFHLVKGEQKGVGQLEKNILHSTTSNTCVYIQMSLTHTVQSLIFWNQFPHMILPAVSKFRS